MIDNKQRVIIIGRNYASRLGMIRAVGVLGYEIHVIRTMRQIPNNKKKAIDIDGYSKYVAGYHFALEPDRDNLVSAIKSLATSNGKTIIIPVDDYAASTIDQYLEDLKQDFLFPNINMQAGAITKLMDKDYQKKLAKEAGLNVAKGWTIEVKDGKFTIPSNITYPCFPKPQISFMGDKGCMHRCDTEEELKSAIMGVTSRHKTCPFIVEEYVEIEKEYAALGFCDGKKTFIPGMIHLLSQGHGGHKGVTLQGKVLPPEEFKNFFEEIEQFLTQIQFVGLFDVDSYKSEDKIYFNELNLRFGASGYAITQSGVNLPEMLINHVNGIHREMSSTIAGDKLFVNEKVAWEDYLGGYTSHNYYKSIITKSNVCFINSKDDPSPYEHFKRRYTISKRLKRTIKLFIKWVRKIIK